MDLNLDGNAVIITASAKGIGKATALLFAEEGANVVINDIDRDAAESTASEVSAKGVECHAFIGDASKEDDIRKLVEFTVEKFGKVDVLVNNVGVGHVVPIWDMTEEEWDRDMDTDVKGFFFAAKHTLRQMMKQKSGRIVNISSCDGIYSTTGHPIPSYTTAKAAIRGFTREVAQEAAPYGIYVNAVAPGFTAVERTKEFTKERIDEINSLILPKTLLGRWAEPREIASAVVFLASDAASFITGEVMEVNGGLVMI